MTMKSHLLISFLCCAMVLLSGCATSDFRPYSGEQKEWPTSPGAFMETKNAVPTYYSPPPRPYEILGYLDATTAPIRRRGVVRYAASCAKKLGGDAIIVLEEGTEYAGTYNSGSAYTSANVSGYNYGNTFYGSGNATTTYSGNSIPMFKGRASVIVIKFKAESASSSNAVSSSVAPTN